MDFADLELCKSPHSVAGLLKLYFRELPDPPLTCELYDCFIAANSIVVPEARLECIKKILKMLPSKNLCLLYYLTSFLRILSNYSSTNKMTAANLAMVFAPNLLRSSNSTDIDVIEDSAHATKILETFISEFDYLFGDISLEDPPKSPTSVDGTWEDPPSPLEVEQREMEQQSQDKRNNNGYMQAMSTVTASMKRFNNSLKETIIKRKEGALRKSQSLGSIKSSSSKQSLDSIDRTSPSKHTPLTGPRPNPFAS